LVILVDEEVVDLADLLTMAVVDFVARFCSSISMSPSLRFSTRSSFCWVLLFASPASSRLS
jgi:hypothetical protein